jgi:hypothetical protein
MTAFRQALTRHTSVVQLSLGKRRTRRQSPRTALHDEGLSDLSMGDVCLP